MKVKKLPYFFSLLALSLLSCNGKQVRKVVSDYVLYDTINYPNGSPCISCRYVVQQYHDSSKIYKKEGELILYYPDGRMFKNSIYKNDELIGEKEFYEDGTIRKVAKFSDDFSDVSYFSKSGIITRNQKESSIIEGDGFSSSGSTADDKSVSYDPGEKVFPDTIISKVYYPNGAIFCISGGSEGDISTIIMFDSTGQQLVELSGNLFKKFTAKKDNR